MTTSEQDSILFQPRFPHSVGGRPILFLRVVKDGDDCFVMKVINLLNKEGEVIAECTIKEKYSEEGCSFETSTEDWGHWELCLLLRTKGIGGKYKEWLMAKEKGHDQVAEENRRFSVIRFDCDPVDGEEAKDWFRKLKVA